MLQCPLSFFDIEPLSQKCGEYRKLTHNNNELTKYFPTYDAVVESITDFPFLPLATEEAVYNEEVRIYQIIVPLSCNCVEYSYFRMLLTCFLK